MDTAQSYLSSACKNASEDRYNAIYFSISGPSAVGKTTVLQIIATLLPEVTQVRLITTRRPRETNEDANHFRFVSRKECELMKARGELAALSASYGDELYGVEHSEVAPPGHRGFGILDLGLANLQQFRAQYRTRSILLTASSMQENRRRITARATESKAEIDRRLESGAEILSAAHEFDYVISNRDSETTAIELIKYMAQELARYRAALSQRIPSSRSQDSAR